MVFQVQKDTLFCRFEANPRSWTAALNRPVASVVGKYEGSYLETWEVGGRADPDSLYRCCLIWYSRSTGAGRGLLIAP